MSHPDINQRIARAEAQRLGNVSLGFFGATDKNLTKSDNAVGRGKISIELQRMFAFGDAPRRALRKCFNQSQPHMPMRMVWN